MFAEVAELVMLVPQHITTPEEPVESSTSQEAAAPFQIVSKTLRPEVYA